MHGHSIISTVIAMNAKVKACRLPHRSQSFLSVACCLLFLLVSFFAPPVLAKTGEQHADDIISVVLGNELRNDPAARQFAKFISQGMDYGGGARPLAFHEPGSSFYEAVQKKFPEFTGKHREFSHWGSRGGIPRQTLEEFEKVYPGQRQALIDLWQEYVCSRQEYVRQALGLGSDATSTRMARSVYSLAEDVHLLGDWTTADTKGLLSLERINADVQRSLEDLVGRARSRQIMEEIKSATKGFRADQYAERARATIRVLRSNGVSKSIASNLARTGFNGTVKTVSTTSLKRAIDEILSERIAVRTRPSRIKPPVRVTTTSPVKVGRTLSRGAGRGARTAARGLSGAGIASKSLKALGVVATIAMVVDFGYEEWKNYNEYDKKQISRPERDRNTASHVGSTAGGLAGGYLGYQAGKAISGDSSSGGKNDRENWNSGSSGGGDLATFLILAAFTAIGSWLGSEAGEAAGETVYDWVAKTPYEQVCETKWINDSDAQYFAGLYKFEGKFTEKDLAKAVDHWRWASDLGNERAQARLGECFYYGIGTPESKTDAVRYWILAGSKGNAQASYYAGRCILLGDGVETNEATGLVWLKKAMSQGSEEARTELSNILDFAIPAAEAGDPHAMKLLGNFCAIGFDQLGVPHDEEKAFVWTEMAAVAGDVDAQVNLANSLIGSGMPEDIQEAKEWLGLAANAGSALAECWLGDMARNDGDYPSAIAHYRSSQAGSCGLGSSRLAEMYERGVGVNPNPRMAFDLMNQAASLRPWSEQALALPRLRPVYRFYSDSLRDHLLTMDEAERRRLENNAASWKYEGVAFHAFNVQVPGSVPLHRFYNATESDHHFTVNQTEIARLSKAPDWNHERIAAWVLPSYAPEAVPVRRFWCALDGDHCFTIRDSEASRLKSMERWKDEGVAFRAWSSQTWLPAAREWAYEEKNNPFVPKGSATFPEEPANPAANLAVTRAATAFFAAKEALKAEIDQLEDPTGADFVKLLTRYTDALAAIDLTGFPDAVVDAFKAYADAFGALVNEAKKIPSDKRLGDLDEPPAGLMAAMEKVMSTVDALADAAEAAAANGDAIRDIY